MRPALTPARVASAIVEAAAAFEVPARELTGRCRLPRVAHARQALYAALYTSCETSYPELAAALHRDHTTLIYGCKRAALLAARDHDYAAALLRIARAAVGMQET
jgi:chromosomal replication initiation ATPase DnaA